MIKYAFLVISLFLISVLSAQQIQDKDLDKLSLHYAKSSFDELVSLLSLPNDAHHPNDIEQNIQWCEKAFDKRGFTTKRLATDKIPLVLANKNYKNATKTVLVYLQVDGQPVDTTKWYQDNPYKATLKKQDTSKKWNTISLDNLQKDIIDPEWRIFARSASDAKGPVLMFLKAMDIINDNEHTPNYNIKVIMDFEEELGSPRLPKAVVSYKKELASNMLIIFDGPRHISNQPTLTYGARGIAKVSLEVFGPKAPQHSGHYGNYIPNPALRLSQLLGSMMQEDGKVAIPGWYNGVSISKETEKILNQVPDDEIIMKQKLGIASIDNIADTYQKAMQYPSLGILGIQSGWVGDKTRTIIPSSAIAEMNIRLVKETNAQHMIDLVKQHIIQQEYHIIEGIPTEEERMKYPKIIRFNYQISYDAFRTDFNTKIGDWLRKAMIRSFGSTPIQIRTGGGSIPISPFVNTLNIPAVIIPTVNKDNNQHSPNENIRLGNYIDGIKTITAILTQKL